MIAAKWSTNWLRVTIRLAVEIKTRARCLVRMFFSADVPDFTILIKCSGKVLAGTYALELGECWVHIDHVKHVKASLVINSPAYM